MADQYIINNMTEIEDEARRLRNGIRLRDTAVVPRDVAALAEMIANLAQTVREGMQRHG